MSLSLRRVTDVKMLMLISLDTAVTADETNH